MTTAEVPIGSKVQVAAGIGYVRWTGSNPKFSAGKWVGVELEGPTGKNDGSVQGERYFPCADKHGVFVRPSQVKILEQPPAPPARLAKPPATPSGSRVSSALASRVTSPTKAPSRGIPATPSRNPSQASIPESSPPGPSSRKTSGASSIAAPARPGTGNIFKRPPSVTEQTPTVPKSAETETPSTARPVSRATATSIDEAPRAVSPTPVPRKLASPQPPDTAGLRRTGPLRSLSSVLSPTLPPIPLPTDGSGSQQPSQAASPEQPTASPERPTAHDSFVQKREIEELRIKVRILESRRTEDQERIKSLESKVDEADALRAARVKLQSKFQELQSSLVAAQRQSRDLQSENALLETRATEATDQLEMAALDREVAEEKAEAAELEIEKMKEKIEELELEVAVLKEENAEYEKPVGPSDEGRHSLAFVQLEKHNERLKEALIRLRDMSSENEKEHKSKLAELEKELSSQEELVRQLELSEAKLGNAESQVEDLKMQLDDALGAEDMLEQLTERNLQLSERAEEMRNAIEDLEALKELNDELEENHVEAEKQLNEAIESLSTQLRDERQRSADLDAVIMDAESTIEQFRDLVGSLQSEIDYLRMQQASQESESASTSKEAQALMNLNLKLQTTAAKAQGKTIDLELKKLEAAQLADHMRIITAYLPDLYHETEADSATMLLFFRRIASKVDTLIATISQLHNIPASLQTASSEHLVGVCELRGRLRHFSTLNKRFSAIMYRCTPDEYIAYGKVLPEVNGVEQRVDGWIAAVKADEFSEGDCARDLASLVAQFDHLAETSFARPDLDVGEQQLGLAYGFDYDLDNFAAAVGFARQAILGLSGEDDVEIDVGDSSLEEGVYEPVQRILDLVRGVKATASNMVVQVEGVVHSGAALLPNHTVALNDLTTSVSNAVDLAVQLAQRIGAHVASIRTSKQPLRLSDINGFLDEVTAESSATSDAPPWDLIGMFVTNLGNALLPVSTNIRQAIQMGQIISIDVPPPWLARVSMIKDAAAHNADTERKVLRLSEELKDMLREIKLRDQSLQESGVKVETLERRLEAARKQADQIIELENDVAKAKKQEKVYEDAIEQLQAEQDALEAENARLRKGQGVDRPGHAASAATGTEPLLLGSAGIESSQLVEQVENLRSAIRFLRRENAMLRSKYLYNDLHLLPRLPTFDFAVEEPVPELEPSSPASTSSSDLGPITPTKHSLATESKLLFKEILAFQAQPKIVDISKLGPGPHGAVTWRSRKESPEAQVGMWKERERRLERRVEGLKERMKLLGVVETARVTKV